MFSMVSYKIVMQCVLFVRLLTSGIVGGVLDEVWVLDDLVQETDCRFGHVIRHSGSVMDVFALLVNAASFDCSIYTDVCAWEDILSASYTRYLKEFLDRHRLRHKRG